MVGLELAAADQKDLAAKALDQALSLYTVKDRPPLAPSLVALATVLSRELPEAPKKKNKWWANDEVSTWLGLIEGEARLKRYGEARQKVADPKFRPNDRLRALTALSEAAFDDKSAGTSDVDAAIQQALAPHQGPPPSPWLLLRLVRIGARAGVAPDSLRSLAAIIADPSLRAGAAGRVAGAVRSRQEYRPQATRYGGSAVPWRLGWLTKNGRDITVDRRR